MIGAAQGTFVARVGVPSFVVTLAGLLIWQGVILKRPRGARRDHHRGGLDQQDRDVLLLGAEQLDHRRGDHRRLSLVVISGVIGQRRAGLAVRPWAPIAKLVGVAVASFGAVAVCTHATRPAACPAGTPLTVNCTQPLGLPLAAVIMLVFLVGLTFLAKRTTFGRHVYAVGGNAEAARRAGINVARVRILVFAISGIMAGVGGIVLAARLQSVNLNVGGGTLLLDSISAAVIGGVSLFGGRGEVRGALLGSLVIATIANGLNIGGYSTGTIYTVTG